MQSSHDTLHFLYHECIVLGILTFSLWNLSLENMNIRIKHDILYINICWAPREVLKPPSLKGEVFQHLPRAPADVNVSESHVWSLLLHKTFFHSKTLEQMLRKMSHLVTKPTKWLCTQRRLRSAWAWIASLCAQWIAKDPSFLHADSEDSDQTRRMPRLIRLGGWPGWSESSLGAHVSLLVLSRGGSNSFCLYL